MKRINRCGHVEPDLLKTLQEARDSLEDYAYWWSLNAAISVLIGISPVSSLERALEVSKAKDFEMSDLVKRLRNLCNNVEMDKWKHAPDGNLTASNALIEVMGKAADEIERLHEALRLARYDMLRAVDHIDDELDAYEKDRLK